MSHQLQFSVEGNDAILVRIFDAPREMVFRAWTEPEHLARWWGPEGVVNKDVTIDARKGGGFSILMTSEEQGWENPVKMVYREFEPPELLVMANHAEVMDPAWAAAVERFGRLTSTITFEDRDGRTELTMRTRFDSPEARDASVAMGAVGGWTQSFARLDAVLAILTATA